MGADGIRPTPTYKSHELPKPLADDKPVRPRLAVPTKSMVPELVVHDVSVNIHQIERHRALRNVSSTRSRLGTSVRNQAAIRARIGCRA